MVLSDKGLPVVAIVGRPNVGKSTLFNRLIRRRRAIVGDEPGITRDRLYGDAEWRGRPLRIVDTGGILPEEKDLIPAEIFRQARVALDEAAAIIMVVDGRGELAGPDLELARLLRKANRPLFLAVNKVDSEKQSSLIDEFHRLGIPQMFPVSAEHGRGVDDLLDAILGTLPGKTKTAEDAEEARATEELTAKDERRTTNDDLPHETKVAIIGHPNVGKSTLLNCLTASDRAIVSPVPGTTRDAVDEVVEFEGQQLRFVDTAGIRRKGKTHLMAEKMSVVMARRHLEAADVALLVLDATDGVTGADATIGGYAHESGRSVIILVNKWDAVTTGRTDNKPAADREIFEKQLRTVLKYLSYAPVIFLSALEGTGLGRVLHEVKAVAEERRKRVSTGQMNRFLERIDFQRAPVPMGKRVRIFYMTQAAVAPPTFVLFTDRDIKLHFSFERFLENQIREAFGFKGTPIWFKVRARNAEKKE
jgi:GTP-binding protein